MMSGKWLIHMSTGDSTDEAWGKVVHMVYEGNSPAYYAKISPNTTDEDLLDANGVYRHVIVVYNR